MSNFINLITSYNSLGLFLHFYKEKLKLSELVTEYANATNNLFFKELIKHVSGNSEGIKNFCQCIKEIIKRNTPDKKYNTDEFFVMEQHKQNQLAKIYSYFKKLSGGNSEGIKNFCQCIKEIIKRNTPDKKYNTDEFFVMEQHKQNQLAKIYSYFKKLSGGNSEGIKNFCQCIKEIIKRNTPDKKYNTDEFFVMEQHKQNQLAKIYSYFKKLSEGEIKPQNEDILKKLKSLDEIFKTTDFTKFTPETEVKDIIKEIDEKYPINENFKQQFRTFRLNIGNLKKEIKNSLKNLEKTREDFERKKERLIREIENDCKNQKVLKFNYDVLLDNIQQICKNYMGLFALRFTKL